MDLEDRQQSQTYQLRPREELRLEAGNDPVYIVLLHGTAEVFGADLELQRKVSLCEAKVAVFSWDGCAIRVDGTPLEPPCAPIFPTFGPLSRDICKRDNLESPPLRRIVDKY